MTSARVYTRKQAHNITHEKKQFIQYIHVHVKQIDKI